MNEVEGIDLDEVVAEVQAADPEIPLDEAVSIAADRAEALEEDRAETLREAPTAAAKPASDSR